MEHLDSLIAMVAVIVSFAIYLTIWFAVGRDSAPGEIVKTEIPPKGLSPEAARYVLQKGFDIQCVTVAMLSAASQGVIRIQGEGNSYSISRGSFSKMKHLSEETQELVRGLVGDRTRFHFSSHHSSRRKLRKVVKEFKRALATKYIGTNIDVNVGWSILGIMISALGIVLAIIANSNPGYAFLLLVWLVPWTFVATASAMSIYTRWKYFFVSAMGSSSTFLNFIGAFFGTVFGTPFLLVEAYFLHMYATTVNAYLLVAVMLSLVMGWCFYHLIKKTTQEGQETLGQIKGFRLWIKNDLPQHIHAVKSFKEGVDIVNNSFAWVVALGLKKDWYDAIGEDILNSCEISRKFTSGSEYPSTFSNRSPVDISLALSYALYFSSSNLMLSIQDDH